jgi:hypothetical protein
MSKGNSREDLVSLILELIKMDPKLGRYNLAKLVWEKHPDFFVTMYDKKYTLMGIQRVAEIVKRRFMEQETNSDTSSPLVSQLKERLFHKRGSHTLIELSDLYDVSVKRIKEALEELKEKGYNVDTENDIIIMDTLITKNEDTILNVEKMSQGNFRFGAIGDNHLASRYERLDVLNALYDHYAKEGISIVYNTGNWIEGEARFNKHDLLAHGLDRQLDYFLERYPQRPGITTRLITGDDHEGWYTQREGINVGKYLQSKAESIGRKDLIFLGHMEHDELLTAESGHTRIRILHPGGGSSYAISYAPQKIIESYTGGDKPDILLIGHYHKASYEYIRGVHTLQTGCTQDQTPFMRKKKLAAHLGGWIFEFSHDKNGAVTRFKSEFFPFYDKAYYKSSWQYHH